MSTWLFGLKCVKLQSSGSSLPRRACNYEIENSVKNFPFLLFDCGHIDFFFFLKFRQPLNFGTYLLLRVWLWRRSSSVGKRKFLRIHLSAGFMPSCTIFKDFQQARLESLLSRFWSPGLMFDTPGVNDFPACITDVSI